MRSEGDFMLSDRDRKILRIIANFRAGRNRFPTLRELQIKTGRPEWDIVRGLKVLAEQRYIELEVEERIKALLEAWERPPSRRYWSH
jgi:hypothetical protein